MKKAAHVALFLCVAVSLTFAQQDSVKVETKNASAVLTTRVAVTTGTDVANVDVRDANLRLSALGSGAGSAFGGRALDFVGNFNLLDRTIRMENRAAGPTTDAHRLAFVDQATSVEMMSLLRGGNLGVGTTAPLGRAEFRQDGGLALVTVNNGVAGPGALSGLVILEGAALKGAVAQNNSASSVFGLPDSLHVQNFTAAGSVHLGTAGVTRVTVTATGNVGIGTTTPVTTLDVNGSFQATTKSFVIDHPTKAGMRLVHACLEGPENAVYYRGEAVLANGSATITLPDYFEALTATAGRTVQLTCKGGWSPLSATDVIDGKFSVSTTLTGALVGSSTQAFFWEVKAVRKDVSALAVEQEKPAAVTPAAELKSGIEKLQK